MNQVREIKEILKGIPFCDVRTAGEHHYTVTPKDNNEQQISSKLEDAGFQTKIYPDTSHPGNLVAVLDKEKGMYKYTVTFHRETENGLAGINLGRDGYSEPTGFDDQGREVYEVYSEYDIDTQLDQREQVVKYKANKITIRICDCCRYELTGTPCCGIPGRGSEYIKIYPHERKRFNP